MITINYRLSEQENNGLHEIIVSPLSYKPLPSEIHTGIYIDPIFFRRGLIYPSRRLKGQHDNAAKAKESKYHLDRFVRRLINIIRVTEDLVPNISEEQISYLMNEDDKGRLSKLGEWITQDSVANALGIENQGRAYTHHRTIQDYFLEYAMSTGMDFHAYEVNTVYARHMLRFELYQQRIVGKENYSLNIDTLKTEDIAMLQDFVKREAEIWESNKEEMDCILEETDQLLPRIVKSKPCKNNGQLDITMMYRIKAVINWLKEKGEIQDSPFDGYEIGRHLSDKIPIVLNEEEINRLYTLDLKMSPSFDMLRDIFIFQCKTGVRLRDVMDLCKSNIYEGNILKYEPKPIIDECYKPDKEVPLDKTCIELIGKHENDDYNGHLFHCISQSAHKSMLQAILKLCGLDRLVLAHDSKARKERWIPLYRKASTELAEATYYYSKMKNLSSIRLQDRRMTKKEMITIYNEINHL